MQQSRLTFCVHGVGVPHCFKTPFFVFLTVKLIFFVFTGLWQKLTRSEGTTLKSQGKIDVESMACKQKCLRC